LSKQDDPMVHTPHLDRTYERELATIAAETAVMADRAERMVRNAVLAVATNDQALAKQVIDADQSLDEQETLLDRLCVQLLARRAPVGSDLRMVTATLKLVTDIERIGDLAVNIAKRTARLDPEIGFPETVRSLADSAVDELALALRSLVQRDAAAARSLRQRDQSTDACNREAFDGLIRLGQERPDKFDAILSLTNVCRHLERIGDHAVNVAEMVVFMVDGKVLRHQPG
jgi:phosphate transport system protein